MSVSDYSCQSLHIHESSDATSYGVPADQWEHIGVGRAQPEDFFQSDQSGNVWEWSWENLISYQSDESDESASEWYYSASDWYAYDGEWYYSASDWYADDGEWSYSVTGREFSASDWNYTSSYWNFSPAEYGTPASEHVPDWQGDVRDWSYKVTDWVYDNDSWAYVASDHEPATTETARVEAAPEPIFTKGSMAMESLFERGDAPVSETSFDLGVTPVVSEDVTTDAYPWALTDVTQDVNPWALSSYEISDDDGSPAAPETEFPAVPGFGDPFVSEWSSADFEATDLSILDDLNDFWGEILDPSQSGGPYAQVSDGYFNLSDYQDAWV